MPHAPTPTETPNARILIVDDDSGTIMLLSEILQGEADIFFATCGEDALEMVRTQQFDLVLLDAEMPGIDGFQVCATIKGNPLHADLPILFVTSRRDIESETMALEAGAVDFIPKPPSPPIVRARVRTHLTLKQRTDELRRLAAVDGLTAVANRRAFDAALLQEWRRACRARAPLSLLMIDVDFFKRYNDTHGHQAGDECLRQVARALSGGVRRAGELVARYGGEEFAIILPASDPEAAQAVAEKLRAAIARLRIPHGGSDVSDDVTISIGIGTLTQATAENAPSDEDIDRACSSAEACRQGTLVLIAAADRALYQAKRSGRDRVEHAVSELMF